MERLPNGVMHIPIFLNVLQAGLYYTKVLVRPLSSAIPYSGPSEDLDITAPDVVAATGAAVQCCARAIVRALCDFHAVHTVRMGLAAVIG